MPSITYVGGMTDVTRKRCEKSIRAFLLQWLCCTNTEGSFYYTYIKGLSFSFPQVQQHGRVKEVWVQVPERAKRGKFTFGSGVRGAMCRVWSEDSSVSNIELQRALEEAIPLVQEYYTKKKKSSPVEKEVAVHRESSVLLKESVAGEGDIDAPNQQNVSEVSEEVQFVIPDLFPKTIEEDITLTEAHDTITLQDFCNTLTVEQKVYLLLYSDNQGQALAVCKPPQLSLGDGFEKKITQFGLLKESKEKTDQSSVQDDWELNQQLLERVYNKLLQGQGDDESDGSSVNMLMRIVYAHDITASYVTEVEKEHQSCVARVAHAKTCLASMKKEEERLLQSLQETQRQYHNKQEEYRVATNEYAILTDSVTVSNTTINNLRIIQGILDQEQQKEKEKDKKKANQAIASLEMLAQAQGMTLDDYIKEIQSTFPS